MTQMAHKIELIPNNKQKTYFMKASGVARVAWNWGLSSWNTYYEFNRLLPKEDRDPIYGKMLKKEFNAIKKEEFPYVYEVTKYACQQPFLQLQDAFNRFFKGLSQRPKFKKRNKSKFSFYIGGDQIKVKDKKVWIPRLGFVKMRESLRFEGKVNSATISKTANRWFVSIQVETTLNKKQIPQKRVGVDLGVKSLATLSNGISILPENPLRKKLRTLAHQQRKLKRKTFGSKNYLKQKVKVSKIHAQIANLRKNQLHKITTSITNNFSDIAIEDLHVKGMLNNHKLARAISDIGLGEFRRQLEYKSKLYGNVLFMADRFFPSSKLCSNCGEKKEDLTLKDRVFECKSCNLKIDRDLNASLNLVSLIKKRRPARPSLMTVEATALDGLDQLIHQTSAREAVSEPQTCMVKFG